MKIRSSFFSPIVIAYCLLAVNAFVAGSEQAEETRAVSTPAGKAPSDAIVLFDGGELTEWQASDGSGPASWSIEDGVMTAIENSIVTKRQFADMQIYLEFLIPEEAESGGEHLVNSGIYIHRNYEIQILDSYQTEAAPVLSCGAVYKRNAPLVNACRKPGVWQNFNIIFHAPRFDKSGKMVTEDATVTVIHNNVLIQDHVEIKPTGAASNNAERPRGPILLQYHDHPVKFRNIWVRELTR